MFRSLHDFNFSNKRVLVRCDFNVPVKDGKVLDDFRIRRALPTINYLKEVGAKVILLSHLGRPWDIKSKRRRKKKYSLEPICERLKELLQGNIEFSEEIIGEEAQKKTQKMEEGDILLLENLRFEKGEEENNQEFAKALAELGEYFVEEAFSVCHRAHASVVSLPKILPNFAGFGLEKEVGVLSQISQNPQRPLVGIIGGAKIESKIKVIKKFLETADHLLLGGKIANVLLTIKGICVSKPLPEDKSIVERIQKLRLTNPKLHLPIDALVSFEKDREDHIRETGPANLRKEEEIFDIGKETIKTFGSIIKQAKTIFWSGPLGLAEHEKFSRGTKAIAEIIGHNQSAFKVVGGGDTIAILQGFGLLDRFSYIATGGGAMLAFLASDRMPGLEALQ